MDEELIRRFKNGDELAFTELVLKYQKTVYNLIYRFTSGKKETEDLFQEVFLQLYRSLKKFRGESKFFTYLYRLTANICLKSRKQLEVVGGDQQIMEAVNWDSPQFKYEQKELKEIIHGAIKKLPPEQRMVVVLYRYNQLAYEEIARITGLSLSAVKSKLHRARQNLKQMLTPYVENLDNTSVKGGVV